MRERRRLAGQQKVSKVNWRRTLSIGWQIALAGWRAKRRPLLSARTWCCRGQPPASIPRCRSRSPPMRAEASTRILWPSDDVLAKALFPITGYTHWLHTRWPAGTVEHLPDVGTDGETNLRGVRIVGDLSGIPLLKFSADTGARAVQAILREAGFQDGGRHRTAATLDLAILGGGVSGISAALEAKKAGLRFEVFEAAEPFTTIVNFPKAKPIYTYPTDMTPAGEMQFHADVKEALLDELERQRKDAGIEVTHARAERVEARRGRRHGPLRRRQPAARLRRRAGSSSPSAAAAISGVSACRARNSTRCPTACTTPPISRAKTSSWSAAAIRRWKRPSRSAGRARTSR